jgi:hypothetical protein
MAATTYSPNVVARDASKALGRTVSAKQVRGIARATMARFSKATHPQHQTHLYTAKERDALLAVMKRRAGIGSAAPKRPARKAPPAKVAPDA